MPTQYSLKIAHFWKRVDPCRTDGCWQWTGYIGKSNGYAYLGATPAHWILGGKSPDGWDWDHLCHNADILCQGGKNCHHRSCVNPEHLELVPHSVNVQRGRNPRRAKTHCPQGHAYDEANTAWHKGWRYCKTCNKDFHTPEYQREWRAKRKQAMQSLLLLGKGAKDA